MDNFVQSKRICKDEDSIRNINKKLFHVFGGFSKHTMPSVLL